MGTVINPQRDLMQDVGPGISAHIPALLPCSCGTYYLESSLSPASMAKQGPRGGGSFSASRQVRVDRHGAVKNTLNAMDKAAEFDRAAASFRRRRKRASTDPTSLSTVRTPAKPVVEAATLTRLVSSVISGRVPCAPTPPAASFQQARECRGLVFSRTYSSGSSRTFPRTISRPSSRTISRMSLRASARTPPGASFVQQQIASSLARAGCRTAIRYIHA